MIELQGRSRWLLWPLAWGSLLTSLAAAAYLWATIDLARTELSRTVTIVLLAAGFVLAIFSLAAQGRVRTVRHLAGSRLGADERNLLAAIRETRALPGWLASATLVCWLVACAVIAFGLGSVGVIGLVGQLRVGVVAIACGPIAAVLVNQLAVRRARAVMQMLCAHLPAKVVVAALQAEKKKQMRRRIVLFVAIMVVLPAALVADAARVETLDVLGAVARTPKQDQADVAREASRDAATRVVLLAALLGALALCAASLAGDNVADPMRQVAEEANRISRGDLREVHVVPAEDEVWAVTSTFTQMQAQLQEIVAQLQRAGISIGSTTEQLMATSSKYESGAADQATSLNETSATTEELAQSARQISHNAGSVSDLAQKTLDAARAGQGSAAAFVSSVDRMKHDNNSIAEAVTRLQKRVQQIGRIVEFITTVADRSDLLALSAELEGTKAGDVGRGFTLVAAEMRRLAENVIESTNEIEELIGEIREATSATVGATTRGLEHTASGTELASSVSQSLESVVALAQSTSDSVRAISLATQQQQTSTDQLAEAMADILGITQQSLAATKQVTSANHELISLSGDLKGLVEQFQVKRS